MILLRIMSVVALVASVNSGMSAMESKMKLSAVYQSSRAGDEMALVEAEAGEKAESQGSVVVDTAKRYQTIRGFGGAFTESSAYVLSLLSPEKRQEVIEAYFGSEGAAYSLMRSHIGSCDFSLGNYSYVPVEGDVDLESFTIEHDRKWVLPLIKDAMAVSEEGLDIIASPWTAPPWMKDNNEWNGGALKPEYRKSFALYIAKYIEAYEKEGIPIWGLTPENEPQGNDSNWESMHFTPEEMKAFIAHDLGPLMKERKLDTKVFVFDQNRNDVEEWVDVVLGDPEAAQYASGTAVHWYSSTVDYYGETLDKVHEKFPDMEVIQSEGCIDALGDDEPEGVWLKSDWYWRKEASDWGYIWAPDEDKKDHPMYSPVNRYVRDMIGCMNHWVTGWVDWNIALDFKGGPNHANNFCGAPVLIDGDSQTVFYTPLFYAMCHFSRFIRPGAERVDVSVEASGLMATGAVNPDGSTAVVVFNEGEDAVVYSLSVDGELRDISIPGRAIQTLVFGGE